MNGPLLGSELIGSGVSGKLVEILVIDILTLNLGLTVDSLGIGNRRAGNRGFRFLHAVTDNVDCHRQNDGGDNGDDGIANDVLGHDNSFNDKLLVSLRAMNESRKIRAHVGL